LLHFFIKPLRVFTWDPTEPIATRPLAIQINGTWLSYGWDLTKNICELYGTTGYISTAYTYTPFGKVTASGSVTQPIQWSSEVWDEEFALVYYNWRYYYAKAGRWLSQDIVFDGHNIYKCCSNKMYLVDNLGLSSPDLGTSKELGDCCYIFTIKVDAVGFNYSSGQTFLKSMTKNQIMKETSVGHTWIRLENTIEQEIIEGGHSGEDPEIREPGIDDENFETYGDGVYALMNMYNNGETAPFPHIPEADPQNPIRWLWHIYQDGHWAEGSGGHEKVTSECSWCISKNEYEKAHRYIDEVKKNIKYYGLTGNQCTSTAAKIAKKAGVNVNPYVILSLPRSLSEKNILWTNPKYNRITFALPDKMQDIMKHAGNDRVKSCR